MAKKARQVSPVETVEAWAGDIRTMWKKPAEIIIRLGKKLLEAEEHFTRDEFARLIGRPGKQGLVPFSYDTARRLMTIGGDERLSRFLAHGQTLPAHWRTLFEITRLTDEQFKMAFERGLIHGETERYVVEHIRQGAYKPEPEPELEPEPEPLPPLPPTVSIPFTRGPTTTLRLIPATRQDQPGPQWQPPAKQPRVDNAATLRERQNTKAIEDCAQAIVTAINDALSLVDNDRRAELCARAHAAVDEAID